MKNLFTHKQFYCIDVKEFDKLISDHYNVYFNLVEEMEFRSPISMQILDVQKNFYLETTMIDAWLSGMYMALPIRDILVDLANKDLIPNGNILVRIDKCKWEK